MVKDNKVIQSIDNFIGEKIYDLRLAKGLSSLELAKQIGVTHNQFKKYENSTSKISIGQLVLILEILDKDIYYFFQELNKIHKLESLNVQRQYTPQHMCIEFSKNFMKIQGEREQQAINNIVKYLARKKIIIYY